MERRLGCMLRHRLSARHAHASTRTHTQCGIALGEVCSQRPRGEGHVLVTRPAGVPPSPRQLCQVDGKLTTGRQKSPRGCVLCKHARVSAQTGMTSCSQGCLPTARRVCVCGALLGGTRPVPMAVAQQARLAVVCRGAHAKADASAVAAWGKHVLRFPRLHGYRAHSTSHRRRDGCGVSSTP